MFTRRGSPSKLTPQLLVTKFETTSSVNNQPTPVHQRNIRSTKNIATVRESVQENLRQSISLLPHEQDFGLSQTSTWRILDWDLKMHLYKIKLTQELKVNEHRQYHLFADWVLEYLEEDLNFGQTIIFSNQEHSWINDYINKQNFCI